MKKILIILLLLPFISFSQECQLEEINWKIEELEYEKQKKYWKNGKVRVENLISNDSLFRIQYFENGLIQLKCPIIAIRQIDSIIHINEKTKTIDSVSLKKNFIDQPNGLYKEFHPNAKVKIEGLMSKGRKINKWRQFWDNGELKEIRNYNSESLLEGTYREFYKTGKIKTEGEYSIEMIPVKNICFDPNTFTEYECSGLEPKQVKSGIWKYYDEFGKLIDSSLTRPMINEKQDQN